MSRYLPSAFRVAAMPPRAVSAATVLALAFIVLVPSGAEGQRERTLLPITPVLERTIGESDVELYRPGHLRATPDGRLVVFDFGELAVRAFSTDGAEVWRRGRKGQGPGEYQGAQDILVDGNGDVLVLDNDNRRVTRLGPDGGSRGSVSLPQAIFANRLLAVRRDELTLTPMGTTHLWVSIDSAGRPARELRLPSAVSFSTSIVGESYSAALDSGAVIAYRWSSLLVLLRPDGSVGHIAEGFGPVEFPATVISSPDIPGMRDVVVQRVDRQASEVAAAVTAFGSTVLVLQGRSGPDARRMVDVWDGVTGRYRGSFRLARPAREIALLPDGRLATLEVDDVPVIRIWRIQL